MLKINYKKLKQKNLFVMSDGVKPETDEQLICVLKKCALLLERAQANRKENTLGEMWSKDTLFEILDCLETNQKKGEK